MVLRNDLSDTVAKEAAGRAAVDLVKSGMLVGLGTGSTTSYFIKHLGDLCRKGLQITAVATSRRSAELAESCGIPIIPIAQVVSIDLTVDGADEVDDKKRLIKGGGGALFREKIVAYMSRKMVVVADSSKRVDYLGRFPLPIEIASFAAMATMTHLKNEGLEAALRRGNGGEPYVTDNGNLIADIRLKYPCVNPEEINMQLKSIPGVIETGFFFNLAHRVLIGFPDGHTEFFDDDKTRAKVE